MSLQRYTYRAMQQRPGRTILTLLSIVIGVSAAVAIGLGTATTRNAYKQMFAMVTGKATLEIDAAGGGGFSEKLLAEVEKIPGVQAAAPLLNRPTSMTIGEDRRVRMEVLGVDTTRDSAVREYEIVSGTKLGKGDELIVEEGFANYLQLKVGDEVRLLTKRLSKPFTIVGTLRSKSGSSFTQAAMAFMPIERAQFHFNPRGKTDLIDKIQIVTAPDQEPEAVETKVAAILTAPVQVHRPAASTQLMQETLMASEQGLRLTTLFSLLMAAFIILNTFLMNVSERRRHLSIMRAVGATKTQITGSLLAESLILGTVGTIIGIGMGVLAAFVVTLVVGRAFQVQLPRLVEVMTPAPFIRGAVFGLTMAVVGAIVPAMIAGRVSPLEGMNRVVPQRSRTFTWIFLVSGTLLAGGAMVGIVAGILGRIPIEMTANFGPMFLIGIVLLDSVFLAPQARFFAWLLRPFRRVEANLALKQVLRNHMRSALTVAVLFIAGSTGVGMANSILDNVNDVHEWYEQAIVGDFFIRAMMPDMATGTAADLPDGLGDELKKLPPSDIKSLEGASFVEATVPPVESSAAEGESFDALTVIVIARTYVEENPPFDLVAGDRKTLRDEIRSGQVVIGSVLAQKRHLKLGDTIPLETREGVQKIRICGIANEYLVGGLAVHMYRDLAVKWMGVEGVDGYIIQAHEGRREALKPKLEAIARKYDVFLLSHGDIRNNIDRIVGGVEWSLWVLVLLGFVVAAFGVVNTLTMNVLEQTRELGLLRIVAMTKDQVRRTIVTQAIIIGGVGLPPGIAMGVAVAYVLNLTMQPSFGHPIDFHLYPWLLVGALGGAFVIVLLAAIIPAIRATRVNVVEALHYE